MQRRKFIQQGCKFCIAVSAGGLVVSLLESCSTIPVFTTTSLNRTVSVSLEQFAINPYIIVRPTDFSYDIAVIKKSSEEYVSLMMRCTHADNAVRFNGQEFKCNLHGSIFDLSGNVEKGPAEKSLVVLKTELTEKQLIIKLI
jgi:Rieske Fe-S protein